MNKEQLEKVSNGKGFIAALDQSGEYSKSIKRIWCKRRSIQQ